jgi:hypothetical protein
MTHPPLLFIDFEFCQRPGEHPRPLCFVAYSEQLGWVERWLDDTTPPNLGPYTLVAYYATAELLCYRVLEWPEPARILDLYVEFSNHINGSDWRERGLLGALKYFHLASIDAAEKSEMRELAMRGGNYKAGERRALLDYCKTDVEALLSLYKALSPFLNTMQALYRGEYLRSVSSMEFNGIPIDVETHTQINEQWDSIKHAIIAEVNKEFQCFDGLTFKQSKFAEYLEQNAIEWPRLSSGALALDKETFRGMAKTYPQLEMLRQARDALANMRKAVIDIGSDGRARCMLSPFSSLTSRNQPSTTKFVFGNAAWRRFLIQPKPGRALIAIDYEQQEFGIAAALSGDEAMKEAYQTGDPYLAFAKQAGAVPPDATKQSHKATRDLYKTASLAVQYGMKEKSLAARLNIPEWHAVQLLAHHKRVYGKYWEWIEAYVLSTLSRGYAQTLFGWRFNASNANERTLLNFPIQAHGAEILRLACALLHERGFMLCAPIHDALLLEAPASEAEDMAETAAEIMQEASAWVLDDFVIRTEAKVIHYPERYTEDRGQAFWNLIQKHLQQQARQNHG